MCGIIEMEEQMGPVFLKYMDIETLQGMLQDLQSDLRILEMSAGPESQPTIPDHKCAIAQIEEELESRYITAANGA